MLTLDKCEQMGADAALRMDSNMSCPFTWFTDEWSSWQDGYDTVFYWVMEFYMSDKVLAVMEPWHQ